MSSRLEIEFLTEDEELRDLCRQYWAQAETGEFTHRVSAIGALLNIRASEVTSRVGSSCGALCRDFRCSQCGTARRFKSRAEFAGVLRSDTSLPWTCSPCKDATRVKALELRDREARLRRELLASHLAEATRSGLTIDRLSLTDLVYLVSVLRAGGTEDMSAVRSLNRLTSRLSPTRTLDIEIVTTLYKRGIVCIHPESAAEAIVIEDGAFTSYYPMKVDWVLPLRDPTPAKFLEALEAILSNHGRRAEWRSEAAELHRTIALNECLEYLQLALAQHQLEAPLGEKTIGVLRFALERFSVAQVYSYIWRAAKDAAAFRVRTHSTRDHAANTTPGAIQRMVERAIANNWKPDGFKRNFDAPQTVVSHVLFTLALRLPDGGFATVVPPLDVQTTTSKGSGSGEDESVV